MTLDLKRVQAELDVSVPIRGLFNLTVLMNDWYRLLIPCKFPSPLGDYLI